jgi:hypothetical protein
MKIWLLMLVPVVAAIALLLFFRKKIAWWEYLSLFGSSFLLILISKLIITTSMTSDTEYWSEPAYKVVYEGAWDEWIEDECSYDCFCSTNDDGYETCQTCWEDCSYRDYHSAYWSIVSNSGKSYGISENEYEKIVDKWGGEKRKGSHYGQDMHSDDGIYESICPKGKPDLIECVVSSHSYTNKVQAAHSVHEYPEVSEDNVSNYALQEYPEIYNSYKQKHILGVTERKAEQNMQALNAELGPSKQCKAFIVVFKNQSEEAGKMQEAYWKGGNKNEFIMTIGINDDNQAQWAYPFSWTENELIKTTTKNFVMQQKKLNLYEVSKYMHSELKSGFERKHFADFEYLTAEPTNRSIKITMIILFIIILGLSVLFIFNRHDETVVSSYIKRVRENGFNDY